MKRLMTRWAVAALVGLLVLGLKPPWEWVDAGPPAAAAQEDTTQADTLPLLSPAEAALYMEYGNARLDNAVPEIRVALQHYQRAARAFAYWKDQVGTATAAETVYVQPAALRSPLLGVAPPDGLPWIFDSDRMGRDEGALQVTFRTDTIGPAQGIVSRDHLGYGQGGHLSIWLRGDTLIYRLQSTDETRVLRAAPIRADSTYRVVAGWGPDGMVLMVDGHLVGWHPDWRQGTAATDRQTVVGGLCSRCEVDTYEWDASFQGEIEKLELWASYRDVDRALAADSRAGPWVGSNDRTDP